MTTSTSFRLFAHIFCICVAFFAGAASVHAQNISTVAGSATAGFAGDNAAATSARLSNPTGVTVDSAGNLYIADLGNNRIRKVSATGIITTVAGTGVGGFSGDGAAATAAQLSAPSRVAVDSAGNLYIADAINNRIRKVTAATGFISTIAGTGVQGFSGDGGLATSAQIGNARGVTVDSAGNIYVADNDNNRIRKIDALSGIITTVAGNGSATFSGDGGLATAAGIGSNAFEAAVDSAGNIFFVSQTTQRIRRVSAATGIITTVAGTGTAGFSGDNGAATAAQVSGPIGVATDSAGNVYIADLNNNRIRKITVATGIITTVAGTGVAGFSGDGAAAVSAQLSQPYATSVDSVGNIYVAELGNSRIRKVTVAASAAPIFPPAVPQVACVIKPTGGINCSFAPGTSTSNVATINGYQISCTNPNGVVVASQTSTGTALNLPTLPTGTIYTCSVVAQSSVGASLAATIQIAPQVTPLAVRGQFDFDGLGFAASLLRGFSSTEGSKATTATTQIGRWDGRRLTFNTIADIGADWNILGGGDLTSTGKSALISRNAAGNVRIDLNLPPTATSGITVRDARLDWVVEAVGDLDGDGKADILWRYMKPGNNDSGTTFAWFMDGTETTVSVNDVKSRGGAPLNWNLAGIIDLNGDKLGDIVWVSPTNQVRALMGQPGRTWTNQLVGQLPAGYSILKLGDVDGDGKGDIVMRDTNGNVRVWLMNGTTIRSTIDLPTTDKLWQFYAAGDFDGNGTMDIIWAEPNGSLTLWLINPTNVAFPFIFPNAGQAPVGLVPVEP
jgi:trimeric autotransporter adhesin